MSAVAFSFNLLLTGHLAILKSSIGRKLPQKKPTTLKKAQPYKGLTHF